MWPDQHANMTDYTYDYTYRWERGAKRLPTLRELKLASIESRFAEEPRSGTSPRGQKQYMKPDSDVFTPDCGAMGTKGVSQSTNVEMKSLEATPQGPVPSNVGLH